MVPHVVVPPTNLFSFIFLFLTYFAWKIYRNTDSIIPIYFPSEIGILTVFLYIFQAKYVRNKKIYISRPGRVRKPVCQYSYIFSKRNMSEIRKYTKINWWAVPRHGVPYGVLSTSTCELSRC
jgi:hypothetical protein